MKKWLLCALFTTSLISVQPTLPTQTESTNPSENFYDILAYTFIATFGISMIVMHKKPMRDAFMGFVRSCKTDAEHEFHYVEAHEWHKPQVRTYPDLHS